MPIELPSEHSLRRVFQQAISVLDIAEPLVSFDDITPASHAAELMDARRFRVIGVRRRGQVVGYMERETAGTGTCGDAMTPFENLHVVADYTPLAELVTRLNDFPQLFVSTLGNVGGLVSRSDLQKPPARMWLFGMVTLIEMRLGHMIRQFCPDDTWREFLSEGRIRKAEELLEERLRRSQQNLQLLDCLQLSDKVSVVGRSEQLRKLTRFESRRKFEEAGKLLEKLRNNLAHAQDIITGDWEMIVSLSENLDEVLDGPPGMNRTDF